MLKTLKFFLSSVFSFKNRMIILTWLTAAPHGAGIKAFLFMFILCSYHQDHEQLNALQYSPFHLLMHTEDETNKAKVQNLQFYGCGRLTAEKKEVWKIFASEAHVKLPQVLQIVSAGCCLCNQIAYLSYRHFSCSLLPVNMHRCGNWKSHHLLLSHSCMWWCLIQALGSC